MTHVYGRRLQTAAENTKNEMTKRERMEQQSPVHARCPPLSLSCKAAGEQSVHNAPDGCERDGRYRSDVTDARFLSREEEEEVDEDAAIVKRCSRERGGAWRIMCAGREILWRASK